MPKPKLKWNRQNIREMLERSDEAVIRGMNRIYSYQTPDEQVHGQTVEDNGLGFNGADAEFMTKLVLYYRQHGHLTPGQMVHARKKMLKYAGQLARFANAQNASKDNT